MKKTCLESPTLLLVTCATVQTAEQRCSGVWQGHVRVLLSCASAFDKYLAGHHRYLNRYQWSHHQSRSSERGEVCVAGCTRTAKRTTEVVTQWHAHNMVEYSVRQGCVAVWTEESDAAVKNMGNLEVC